MPYQLDANAWIHIINDQAMYENLLESFQSKNIEIVVTHQIVDELSDRSRILDVSIISRNLASIEPFMQNVEVDSIFVLGFSRLDTAKFATQDSSSLFEEHLASKENRMKHIKDAIHLVNAMDSAATLVSCDSRVRSTAKYRGLNVTCFVNFVRSHGLANPSACSGCPVLGEGMTLGGDTPL
jgi:hypothetical protein